MQRKQISDSYRVCASKNPKLTRWCLCIHFDLNIHEIGWLQTLCTDGSVEITWIGETRIQNLLARYSDITAHFFPESVITAKLDTIINLTEQTTGEILRLNLQNFSHLNGLHSEKQSLNDLLQKIRVSIGNCNDELKQNPSNKFAIKQLQEALQSLAGINDRLDEIKQSERSTLYSLQSQIELLFQRRSGEATEQLKIIQHLFATGKSNEAISIINAADREKVYVQFLEDRQKFNNKDELKIIASCLATEELLLAIDFLSNAGDNERYQRALPCLRRAIEYCPISMSCFYYAQSLHGIGERKQAFEWYQAFLSLRNSDSDKRLYAQTYIGLASICGEYGQIDDALSYLENALTVAAQEEENEIALIYNNLGLFIQQQGQFQRGIEFLNKSLEISKRFYGEEHREIATIYNNLGLAWQGVGNISKAITLFEKAMMLDQKLFGDRHHSIARDLHNIGWAYSAQLQWKKSLHYYNQSIEMFLVVTGEDHLDVAGLYENLGIALLNTNSAEDARRHFNKSIIVKELLLGDINATVGKAHMVIGNAFYTKGYLNDAFRHYKKSLNVRLELFGHNSIECADCYRSLGNVLADSKKPGKAINYFEKTRIIYEQLSTVDKEKLNFLLRDLGVAYMEVGNTIKGLEMIKKSGKYIQENGHIIVKN